MLDFIKDSGTFSISHSKYSESSKNLFDMTEIETKSVVKKENIIIVFLDIVDAARLWEDYFNFMHNIICKSNYM